MDLVANEFAKGAPAARLPARCSSGLIQSWRNGKALVRPRGLTLC